MQYVAAAKATVSGLIVIGSIDTPDRWTVVVHLETPYPSMPLLLSEFLNWGLVSSPRAVANPSLLANGTDGAGPYTMVPSESVLGDHYTFVPNSYYPDKSAIKFSKVIVRVIPTPSSMLAAVRAGQVDVAVGDESSAAAATSAGITVLNASAAWDGLQFLDRNGSLAPALKDPRVRQALNYAIDRKTITAALMGKYSAPTSEATTLDSGTSDVGQYTYDPNKAKALLAAAGYKDGFSFGVVDQGYSGNTGDPMVQAVAKYLAAVGVKLNVTTATTNGEWLQALFSGKYSAMQICFTGIVPMSTFYPLFLAPKGVVNPFKTDDPVLDKLYLKAARSNNAGSYYGQMAHQYTTQAYFLPVFEAPQVYFVSKRTAGVVATGSGAMPYASEWSPK
jgi:peptide/nickel transport system substrate-binding protein